MKQPAAMAATITMMRTMMSLAARGIPSAATTTSVTTSSTSSLATLRRRTFASTAAAQATSRSAGSFTFSTKFPRSQRRRRGPQTDHHYHLKKKEQQRQRTADELARRLPERLRLVRPRPVPHSSTTSTSSSRGSDEVAPWQRTTPVATTTTNSSSSNRSARETRNAAYAAEAASRRRRHADKFALSPVNPNTHQTTKNNKNTKNNNMFEQTTQIAKTKRNSSFAVMQLHPLVLAGITSGLGYTRPTPVQALALPAAAAADLHATAGLRPPMAGILVAAETGSGKTAAYLAAVMHHLKHEEDALVSSSNASGIADKFSVVDAITATGDLLSPSKGLAAVRKLRRPRALVIVPSRHLVAQITAMAKALAHHAKLRVAGVHAKTPARTINAALTLAPVDILVGTPGAILDLIESKTIALSQTRHVVIDEADTLFDTNFKEEIMPIVTGVRDFAVKLKRACHFIMTTATLPKTLTQTLQSVFTNVNESDPNGFQSIDSYHTDNGNTALPAALTQIVTPMLHRTSKNLKQVFLHLDGSTTKPNLLIEVLKRTVIHHENEMFEHGRSGNDKVESISAHEYETTKLDKPRGKNDAVSGGRATMQGARVLIFCNRAKQCDEVSEFLREKGYTDVCVLTSATDTDQREEALSRVLDPAVVKQRPTRSQSTETDVDNAISDPSSIESPHMDVPASRPFIIVATDMASRGLDTTRIDHVILYDFPQTSIDYLHRVGRSGRNGAVGRATAFVTRRDAVLANAIQTAIKYREPLV